MPKNQEGADGVRRGDMVPENQQGALNADSDMPRSAHLKAGENGGENQGLNLGIDEEGFNHMGGSTSFNAILDELAKNSQGDSKAHGKGLDRNFSEGMKKARSDGKQLTGLGIFLLWMRWKRKLKPPSLMGKDELMLN